MSGHSKWSTIKHKKGAADAKRGKLFTKLSRSILVAAKEGGPDPATNMALANAIEKARSYSMPKDNIDRAVAKGSGEGTDGAIFETVVYEGYGPEGVAVIVEALTDNRNRTAADVRHLFSKHGGNLGATGAVAWQFERRGIVLVPAEGVDEEELFLAVAEAGADDVDRDGSVFQVSSAPDQLSAVRQAVESAGFAVESAELSMVPKVTVEIGDEPTAKKVVGSSRVSRTTTTFRTSTRTSTSPRPCSRRSRRSGGADVGRPSVPAMCVRIGAAGCGPPTSGCTRICGERRRGIERRSGVTGRLFEMRWIGVAAAVAALAFAVAGCGGSSDSGSNAGSRDTAVTEIGLDGRQSTETTSTETTSTETTSTEATSTDGHERRRRAQSGECKDLAEPARSSPRPSRVGRAEGRRLGSHRRCVRGVRATRRRTSSRTTSRYSPR